MTGMRDLIAELPAQLEWAASLSVGDVPEAREALVAGMGGSGFAGDVAAVVAEAEGKRVSVHKGYGLPRWAAAAEPLVVCVSHSGNTEETLSAARSALESGLALVTVATGGALAEMAETAALPHVAAPPGPQPRAAAGYLAGGTLRLLEAAGVIGPVAADLSEAAEVTSAMLAEDAAGRADAIADALVGRATIIYGGLGLPAAAAGRWKTQVNENAKAPAWWSFFSELDHNEIVGWTAFPGLGMESLAVVFLSDASDHPRITQRARLTAELMEGVTIAGHVASRGSGIVARLFSLVLMGDLVSVSLAEKAGVDPMPVHVIENLKKRLKESE